MNPIVYLDNSATTKPCFETIDAVSNCLKDAWGNPSSTHTLGVQAYCLLEQARNSIASFIGAKSDEIIFTGSGTEANNLALIGAAFKAKRLGNRIVSTTIEHPSVLKVLDYLQQNGFEVIRLSPDKNGVVPTEKFAEVIDKNTILVSVMLVNNEIGSIQPVDKIKSIIKQNGSPALLHCDAVQGFGKLPIKVSALGVDLLSASGHKIHATKGIGFLYKAKGVTLSPVIYGGGQEKGLRSGTEAMPLIMGLAAAVKSLGDIKANLKHTADLFEYTIEKLNATGLVSFNSPKEALPYILNISVNGYKAEPILNALSSKNIFVSKGSACAKGQRSYVLSECGFDIDRIDSAIRLSFSRNTQRQDIDIFINTLCEITQTMRRYK